jgi:hypothetical protein
LQFGQRVVDECPRIGVTGFVLDCRCPVAEIVAGGVFGAVVVLADERPGCHLESVAQALCGRRGAGGCLPLPLGDRQGRGGVQGVGQALKVIGAREVVDLTAQAGMGIVESPL